MKRARIVPLAAAGRSTRSIAKQVGVRPRIVSKWRHRFADHGLAGDDVHFAIHAFIEAYNTKATPFAWTKKRVYQRRFNNRRITQL